MASWRDSPERSKWADVFRGRLKAALLLRFGTIAEAARELGAPYKTLDRWLRVGSELPRIDDVWSICRAGSIASDHLLWNEGGAIQARTPKPIGVPWLAESWNETTRRELAVMLREYMYAFALDCIRDAHAGDMAHLRALSSDPAHAEGPDDLDADREIVEDVVTLASDYLEKLHFKIREDVRRNIDKRLAGHMRSHRRAADLAKEQAELRAVAATKKPPTKASAPTPGTDDEGRVWNAAARRWEMAPAPVRRSQPATRRPVKRKPTKRTPTVRRK